MERPKVGIGVYILNDKQELLLLKRWGAHGSESWCPPGGHLEFGEEFADCAKREVAEETGLRIAEATVVGITNDIFRNEEKHYVTLAMRATEYQGEAKIMEPEKATAIGWFSLHTLPTPLFIPVENFLNSNPQCLCGSSRSLRECHGK